MPTCYTPSDRAWSDAITREVQARQALADEDAPTCCDAAMLVGTADEEHDEWCLRDDEPATFPTGAMCGTCGFECDPGDTRDAADAAHLAFDPAHEPSWHEDY